MTLTNFKYGHKKKHKGKTFGSIFTANIAGNLWYSVLTYSPKDGQSGSPKGSSPTERKLYNLLNPSRGWNNVMAKSYSRKTNRYATHKHFEPTHVIPLDFML